jgi:hypothetical protein
VPLAEWVLAAAIVALPMATVAAAAMIVAVMVLRMARSPLGTYGRLVAADAAGRPANVVSHNAESAFVRQCLSNA